MFTLEVCNITAATFFSLTAVLIPVFMTGLLTPFYIKMLKRREIVVTNFRGQEVATTGGVILLAVWVTVQALYLVTPGTGALSSISTPLIHYSHNDNAARILLIMFFYSSGIALLGLFDDLCGDKTCKGFRGHFRMLWHKKVISTGLVKAAGGLTLGILAAALAGGGSWPEWLLKGVFLALFSNFFNLLDTRPGRTAGVYLFSSLLLAVFFRELVFILFPLWSALYIYLFWERKAGIMLGDTGAYLLGGIPGFLLMFKLAPVWLLSFNVILLFLHYYLEKHSLNTLLGKLTKRKKYLKLPGPERGS